MLDTWVDWYLPCFCDHKVRNSSGRRMSTRSTRSARLSRRDGMIQAPVVMNLALAALAPDGTGTASEFFGLANAWQMLGIWEDAWLT